MYSARTHDTLGCWCLGLDGEHSVLPHSLGQAGHCCWGLADPHVQLGVQAEVAGNVWPKIGVVLHHVEGAVAYGDAGSRANVLAQDDIHQHKYVECNGWWFLCLYKADRARAFKKALQSLQYSVKSLQFLMFVGNSVKIVAAECWKVPCTDGTLSLGATSLIIWINYVQSATF